MPARDFSFAGILAVFDINRCLYGKRRNIERVTISACLFMRFVLLADPFEDGQGIARRDIFPCLSGGRYRSIPNESACVPRNFTGAFWEGLRLLLRSRRKGVLDDNLAALDARAQEVGDCRDLAHRQTRGLLTLAQPRPKGHHDRVIRADLAILLHEGHRIPHDCDGIGVLGTLGDRAGLGETGQGIAEVGEPIQRDKLRPGAATVIRRGELNAGDVGPLLDTDHEGILEDLERRAVDLAGRGIADVDELCHDDLPLRFQEGLGIGE